MAWDFWGKSNNNPFRGGFASNGTGRLYRNPFTGELSHDKQDYNQDGYRREWEKNRCNSSGDCGSGYSCIDGQCVKVHTRDGSRYQPDTCGDEQIQWAPCKKGNTKKGSNDKCSKPTPGDCERDPICPGVKCCRQQRDGSIRCVCGPCEQTDWASCNPYCDSYYKSFGEVAAGCYTKDMDGFGECGGNICDECKYCSIHTKRCEAPEDEFDANFNNLPCWCGGCDEDCHICDKDPDSSKFGDCVYSPNHCAQCCTQYNYECPQCPNKYIPVAHHCEPVTSLKSCIAALREKLYAQCAQECSNEPDPCAPTGSFSFCEDGTPTINCNLGPLGTKCPNPDGFVCPQGKTCENAGYLQVNGQTCWFFNTWVTEDIPPECEECDCNCHDDCKDCELCNAYGKCVPDPGCDKYFHQELVQIVDRYDVCLQFCSQYPDYTFNVPVYTDRTITVQATHTGETSNPGDTMSLSAVATGASGPPQSCGVINYPGAKYFKATVDGVQQGTAFFGSDIQGDCPGPGFYFGYIRVYDWIVVTGLGDTPAEAAADAASKRPEGCSSTTTPCTGDGPLTF